MKHVKTQNCVALGTSTIILLAAVQLNVYADNIRRDPGDIFRDCPECPEMVVLPPGKFRMGDITGGGFSYEQPVHTVTIPESFAVGVYEVTVGQFLEFAEETGYRVNGGCNDWTGKAWEIDANISWRNPGFSLSTQHPSGCMNWNDAQAYAKWLSQKTGMDYRLLSEAEWEYASRGGTSTKWFFGDNQNDICRYGNVRDETYRSSDDSEAISAGEGVANKPRQGLYSPGNNTNSGVECNDGSFTKSTVGSFQPNGFGLYDTAGNVYEWTEDCWTENYKGAPDDGTPWMSGNCNRHALRGGSWPSRPGGFPFSLSK